jgi:hypothetical protein
MSLFSKFFGAGKDEGCQQCLSLEQDKIIFVGGANYPPIELEEVISIDYQVTQEQWQEVQIETHSQGKMTYHFDANAKQLQAAVEQVKQTLKPSQPICQLILSAKQGSLSGKD